MSQESIQINKSLVKHLRIKSGDKQKTVAHNCGYDLRQYQNVEQNGRTTLAGVKRIAKHYKMDESDFLSDKRSDDSLWYSTTPYSLAGKLTLGYYETLVEIITEARRVADVSGVALNINTTHPQLIKCNLNWNDHDRQWTFRPVNESPDVGLIWSDCTDWQRENLHDDMEGLLYTTVDNVWLNGVPLIPKKSNPTFVVNFIEYNYETRTRYFKGHRLFDSESQFRCTLTKWIDELTPLPCSPYIGDGGSLSITNHAYSSGTSQTIIIRRVWVDQNNSIHNAPWPKVQIDSVVHAITELRDGKRIWALPIGASGQYEGDIPPMTPNVLRYDMEQIEDINIEMNFNKGEKHG